MHTLSGTAYGGFGEAQLDWKYAGIHAGACVAEASPVTLYLDNHPYYSSSLVFSSAFAGIPVYFAGFSGKRISVEPFFCAERISSGSDSFYWFNGSLHAPFIFSAGADISWGKTRLIVFGGNAEMNMSDSNNNELFSGNFPFAGIFATAAISAERWSWSPFTGYACISGAFSAALTAENQLYPL